jgi:sugar phosphate isomerase/epimerase
VLDNLDSRTDGWAPAELAGNSEAKRAWAIRQLKLVARAARNLGVSVVNGFTGSSIWHLLYSFPAVPDSDIEAGYSLFAERWNPILDEFKANGVRFALEVHPTEIAFDFYSAGRALDAIGRRPEFGFNFDPSHLQWQGVDSAAFIYEYGDRIYHMHVKDARVRLDGRAGILASHLNFGDPRRGWDFVSPGRGGVNFEEIVRALNHVGYAGPLSVEWEDSGMHREFGAAEAAQFVRRLDFAPSTIAFDAQFQQN